MNNTSNFDSMNSTWLELENYNLEMASSSIEIDNASYEGNSHDVIKDTAKSGHVVRKRIGNILEWYEHFNCLCSK